MSEIYKRAGVDINAGYEAVKGIEHHVKKTMRPEVMSGIGSFGAGFDLSKLSLKEPVLVSGTDGVGTKLKLAIDHGKHDTIGIDAVAMCVNDILTTGAEPLFFLDYIAANKVHPEQISEIVSGVAAGCEMAGCALIGGETAEMGDMYGPGEYDIAGFSVGAVEKSWYINSENVSAGDKIIGLSSSGVHSNGYSLVRKLLKEHAIDVESSLQGDKIIDLLLEPTRIYVKSVQVLLKKVEIKAMSHITGGGFIENIPRALPENLGASISTENIQIPKIIKWLMNLGDIDIKEAYNIFNMGIGFILIVNEKYVEKTLQILQEQGEEASVIGEVTNGKGINIHA